MGNTNESNNPLISILIPAYNIAEYLPQCLDSAIGQTYSNLEIVVIDDGSTDKTGEILDQYAARDSRIHAIHQPNAGLMVTRGRTIAAAQGEYIYFLDGDDYLPLDAIQLLYEAAAENQADIVSGNYYRTSPAYCIEVKSKQIGTCTGLEYLQGLLSHWIEGFLCTKLYKRELFSQIDNRNNSDFAEDLYVNLQIGCRKPTVTHIDRPVYYYVKRTSSLSHHILPFEFHTRFAGYVNEYLQAHLSESDYRAIRPWFVMMKTYFFTMYINKTSNPGMSHHPYTIQLYNELNTADVRPLYRRIFSTPQRAIIRMHRRPATAWIGKLITTGLRIQKSISKRLGGSTKSLN